MKDYFLLIVCTTLCISLYSCSSDKIIDQNYDVNNGIWNVDSLASFTVEMPDTTSGFDVSYNIRYGIDYPYYNLYVTYYQEDSASQIMDTHLQEIILFDKKTGKPLGSGVGDLFDREVLIFENHRFPYAGKYNFKIKQFMRMDELPGILSFGLKMKKTGA